MQVGLHEHGSYLLLGYLTRSIVPITVPFNVLQPTPVRVMMPVTITYRTPSKRRRRKIEKRMRMTKKKLRKEASRVKLKKADSDLTQGRRRSLTAPLFGNLGPVNSARTRCYRQMASRKAQRNFSQSIAIDASTFRDSIHCMAVLCLSQPSTDDYSGNAFLQWAAVAKGRQIYPASLSLPGGVPWISFDSPRVCF